MTKPSIAQPSTMTRIKRSRSLQVTSLMATASFSLVACGSPPAASGAPALEGPRQAALAYESLDECRTANVIADAECDTAYAQARQTRDANGPRYASREECEGAWGPSQCEPNRSGGSFFTPLLAGFVVGQLLGGGRGFGGGPLYRDRDNRLSNGFGGGYLQRDYRTGRNITDARAHTPAARQAPPRVQSRTTVVSRGGFGGGGRGYGG